jgi:hypothetical protein
MMNKKLNFIARVSIIAIVCMVMLFGCSGKSSAQTPVPGSKKPGVVKIDILYLNHGPVIKVLDKMKPILDKYRDKLSIDMFDFDTEQASVYARKHKLTGHVPLAVFIDGSLTFDFGNRKTAFISFPKGEGPGMIADGDWSFSDFDEALRTATGK